MKIRGVMIFNISPSFATFSNKITATIEINYLIRQQNELGRNKKLPPNGTSEHFKDF